MQSRQDAQTDLEGTVARAPPLRGLILEWCRASLRVALHCNGCTDGPERHQPNHTTKRKRPQPKPGSVRQGGRIVWDYTARCQPRCQPRTSYISPKRIACKTFLFLTRKPARVSGRQFHKWVLIAVLSLACDHLTLHQFDKQGDVARYRALAIAPLLYGCTTKARVAGKAANAFTLAPDAVEDSQQVFGP